MIITTTNTIENHTIKRYIEVVNANVVIGANLFSDFTASLTDVFGGRSGTYQNKLNAIYREAMNELEKKANSLNADAIIGLHIDFDEVSGGGKSMFMVSASGTAVILEDVFCGDRYEMYRKLSEINGFYSKGLMSEEEYNYEKEKVTANYNNPISHEVKVIKEKQKYEDNIVKEKEEAQIRIQESKIEDAKKTFVFGGLSNAIE